MCVYGNGCLNAISDAETDLLMYLLSKMREHGSHLIQKGNVLLCLVSIVRANCRRRIGSMNIDYIQRSG